MFDLNFAETAVLGAAQSITGEPDGNGINFQTGAFAVSISDLPGKENLKVMPEIYLGGSNLSTFSDLHPGGEFPFQLSIDEEQSVNLTFPEK